MTMTTAPITRRICPVCEEPFEFQTPARGRLPVFCTKSCRKEAHSEPRDAVKRWCPTCEEFFYTDMTDRLGSAPTYCSEECSEKNKSLRRYISTYTCYLGGCINPVDHPRYFCSEEHRQQFITEHPEWETCRHCTQPIPLPDELRLPPKFCNNEHRQAFVGLTSYHATQNAIRERTLDNRQRTTRFAKEGKKGRRSTKPHDYLYAMSHVEKLRWGLYPERILIGILQAGWKDEEEFFTTEDRWSPAVYEMIKGVPVDARTPVGASIGVRDYGETEPRTLPPDTAAPSAAEYKARARQIKADYEAETETPAYVDAYITTTGHNPERR